MVDKHKGIHKSGGQLIHNHTYKWIRIKRNPHNRWTTYPPNIHSPDRHRKLSPSPATLYTINPSLSPPHPLVDNEWDNLSTSIKTSSEAHRDPGKSMSNVSFSGLIHLSTEPTATTIIYLLDNKESNSR
jgi:hypothetical protein